MAKRSSKKSSASRPRRQALSQKKRAIETLRKKGLIRRDEFKGKLGGSASRVIAKYKDVLEGRAVVVKPSSRLIPKRIRKALKERHGRVVVPKVNGRISTTVGQRGIIRRTRRGAGGELIRETVATPQIEIPKLPPNKVYRVSIRNSSGHQWSTYYRNQKLLDNFLEQYDNAREWFDISVVDLPAAFKDA